jgi:hypothetical protein
VPHEEHLGHLFSKAMFNNSKSMPKKIIIDNINPNMGGFSKEQPTTQDRLSKQMK